MGSDEELHGFFSFAVRDEAYGQVMRQEPISWAIGASQRMFAMT